MCPPKIWYLAIKPVCKVGFCGSALGLPMRGCMHSFRGPGLEGEEICQLMGRLLRLQKIIEYQIIKLYSRNGSLSPRLAQCASILI